MCQIEKLLIAVAFACGYSQPGSDPLASLSADTPLEKFETDLQGTWSRPCQFSSTAGYYKEVLAFSGTGGSFTLASKDFFYSDPNCTALSIIRSQAFQVGDLNPTGTGWSLSASIVSQSFAAQTSQAAASLNLAHACGITQWAVGLTLDTTNTGCNSMGNGSILDTLYLANGLLNRSLDEVVNPNVISGTLPQGVAYTRQQ